MSSLQRTPRFACLLGDFFGVTFSPLRGALYLRLRGEAKDLAGEEYAFSHTGTGNFIGDGAISLTGFLLFGVPRLVGGNASVTGRPPSGLMT